MQGVLAVETGQWAGSNGALIGFKKNSSGLSYRPPLHFPGGFLNPNQFSLCLWNKTIRI